MDPTNVAAHAVEVVRYQFKNNFPIKDKDTIDGIKDDELICVGLNGNANTNCHQLLQLEQC